MSRRPGRSFAMIIERIAERIARWIGIYLTASAVVAAIRAAPRSGSRRSPPARDAPGRFPQPRPRLRQDGPFTRARRPPRRRPGAPGRGRPCRTGRPRSTRLVTPWPRMPQGTMPAKCPRSGSTLIGDAVEADPAADAHADGGDLVLGRAAVRLRRPVRAAPPRRRRAPAAARPGRAKAASARITHSSSLPDVGAHVAAAAR